MDLWSGKKHLKWSLIVRGKHVMGCFRVITFNVLFLCKLIKLSLLQIIKRMNKCELMEFICKFFFSKVFCHNFCPRWVSALRLRSCQKWSRDPGPDHHPMCDGLLSGCQSPRDRYRNRIREFVDCDSQFPSLFVKSPPPLLYGADGPEVSWHVTRGQYCAEMRILAMFYFRQRTPVAGFNWNLNDH